MILENEQYKQFKAGDRYIDINCRPILSSYVLISKLSIPYRLFFYAGIGNIDFDTKIILLPYVEQCLF